MSPAAELTYNGPGFLNFPLKSELGPSQGKVDTSRWRTSSLSCECKKSNPSLTSFLLPAASLRSEGSKWGLQIWVWLCFIASQANKYCEEMSHTCTVRNTTHFASFWKIRYTLPSHLILEISTLQAYLQLLLRLFQSMHSHYIKLEKKITPIIP